MKDVYSFNDGCLGCTKFPFTYIAPDGEEFKMEADFHFHLDGGDAPKIDQIERIVVRYADREESVAIDGPHAKALREAAEDDSDLINEGRFLLAEAEENATETRFTGMFGLVRAW